MYVIANLNTHAVITKEFSEDEIDEMAEMINARRIGEGCQFDYGLIESETGKAVSDLVMFH